MFWRRWAEWSRTSDSLFARWLRVAKATLLGEMPILAAGTALFAIIAVVPTLAASVAIYGLVADPFQIQHELSGLERVMPSEVVRFLGEQLQRQALRSNNELGLQLGISVLLAVVSARTSARALIDSLNRAYRVREQRTPFVKLSVTLAMAVATLAGIMAMFALLVVLPGIVGWINEDWIEIAMWVRWPAMLSVVFCVLLAMYRFAPSPRPLGDGDGGHVCAPGALTATALLLGVSVALSIWVERISNTDVIYGAFGSAIVLILWFYLSTMSLVIGGFVNGEIERHRGAPAPDRSMY